MFPTTPAPRRSSVPLSPSPLFWLLCVETTSPSTLNRLNFKHHSRSNGITHILKQRYKVWRWRGEASHLDLLVWSLLLLHTQFQCRRMALYGIHTACAKSMLCGSASAKPQKVGNWGNIVCRHFVGWPQPTNQDRDKPSAETEGGIWLDPEYSRSRAASQGGGSRRLKGQGLTTEPAPHVARQGKLGQPNHQLWEGLSDKLWAEHTWRWRWAPPRCSLPAWWWKHGCGAAGGLPKGVCGDLLAQVITEKPTLGEKPVIP